MNLLNLCFRTIVYTVREIANNQPKHPLGVDYNTPLIEYTFYKQFWKPALDEGIVDIIETDEAMGKNDLVS
ncbi:hypothetical protein [Neobacillus sp. LXY-1]|uniref:hypothetical protein n=1 Tax=Neobacillus sp. LXY-1 TaxID=3379133 RepID=UPI003EE26CFE